MRRPLSVFCVLFVTAVRILLWWSPKEIPGETLADGQRIVLSGVIEAVEETAGGQDGIGPSCRFRLGQLQVLSGQELPQGAKILCIPDAVLPPREAPLPGDRVKVIGWIGVFPRAANEGEFDSALYYQTLGICCRVREARFLKVEPFSRPLFFPDRLLFRVRCRLGESLDDCFEAEEAGIMRAVLLGERRMADDTLLSLYKRGGIMHLLVISGLHISLFGTGLKRLLEKLRCPPRAAAVLSAAFMLVYCRMTGMSSSACRALWMFTLFLAARLLGRTYDMTTAALSAGAVLIAAQPLLLLNSGFLFSFCAVLGIALLGPALPEKLSFAAIPAATLPVHLWFYYEYPVCGILLNLLVVPFLPVLLLSGAGSCLLGLFSVPAGKAASIPARFLLSFYGFAAEKTGSLPWSRVITGRPSVIQVTIYFAVLLILVFTGKDSRFARTGDRREQRKEMGRHLLRGLLLAAAVFFLTLRPSRTCSLCFLDVGQGDGIYVESGARRILIDGGSSSRQSLGDYVLIPFLKYHGAARLDLVILTHEDYDHCSGIEELLEKEGEPGEVRISRIALPAVAGDCRGARYRRIEELAQEKGIPVIHYARGDVIRTGALTLTCLHPEEQGVYQDPNEGSGVFFLRCGDFSALLTGDLEGTGEEQVTKLLLGAGGLELTVLKAAHHGSANATGAEFLRCVKAEFAVISCGENNLYGHPAPETVRRLEEAGCKILDTRTAGEIRFLFDEEHMNRLITVR